MADHPQSVGTVRREDLPEICDRDDVIAKQERIVDREEFEVAERRSTEGDYPAGAVVYDDRGRILLLENDWSDGWTIPAGLAKHGESMDEAARREVREETGVDPVLTDVAYVVDSEIGHPERDEWLSGYFVVFEGYAPDPDPGDPADLGESDEPIHAVDWFDELPENVYNRELVGRILDREGSSRPDQ